MSERDKCRKCGTTERYLIGSGDQCVCLGCTLARIEELEKVCERASSELSVWDSKASADPSTSIGYVVKILREAVHPEAAKEGAG